VARLREEQVEDYLGVERPVTRVVEDEHGIYFYSVVTIALAVFSGRQSTVGYWTSVGLVVLWGGEWPQSWECGYEIGRCEDICETVAVGVTWSIKCLSVRRINSGPYFSATLLHLSPSPPVTRIHLSL
jgi:hypothetical protein